MVWNFSTADFCLGVVPGEFVPSLFAVDLDSFELRVAEGNDFSLPKLLKISWADHLCFPVTKKHDANA